MYSATNKQRLIDLKKKKLKKHLLNAYKIYRFLLVWFVLFFTSLLSD